MASNNTVTYDVIVIGAGLAGLAAAHAASIEGKVTIALVDFQSPGAHDPSPLTFMDIVTEFGLSDCVKEKYRSFMFHNPGGSSVTYNFQSPFLAVLDYRKACSVLFERVRKSGVDFIKKKIVGIIPGDLKVELKLDDGKMLSSRVVINASGSTGIPCTGMGESEKAYYSHVYGAQFTGVDPRCGTLCNYILPNPEFGTGGGWFYSLGSGEASFGYAQISTSPLPDLHLLKKRFELALKTLDPYARYMAEAKISHIEQGVIPLTYKKPMVQGRVLLTGDAAGIATSWTCMGIESALKYGTFAGKAALSYIAGDDPGALSYYETRWIKENGKIHDEMARMFNWFWTSGYDFWEWIVKNDLAYLTPAQVLERIRNNAHLISKAGLLKRIIINRIKLLFYKRYSGEMHYLRK